MSAEQAGSASNILGRNHEECMAPKERKPKKVLKSAVADGDAAGEPRA